ncbi:LD-carboxypeptidase [Spiroplasma culicicola]|uniref:LD-carboxypeptidase N-terminal domain-containing protein n=1 Tax=Spiroplasma culicicola AES-1 TaxID=1276246 RepID=W6A6W5_9MOLU|nr:LD-carboxypeptidase [Spiroplasma culicicola]AHI52873.1 hypothetical protein SCULI_v1c05320 [Spiroplasma culicicola AES-1]
MKLGLFHPSDFLTDNKIDFQNSIDFFIEKGFTIIKPDEKSKNHGRNVGLAFEFNKMIQRKPKLVLPTYCFENTNTLIDLIDWKLVKKSNSIFCGNSYATTILNAVVSNSNNRVFYGPNFIKQFNQEQKNEYYINLIDCINSKFSKKGQYNENNILLNDWIFEGTKKITGNLIGGEIESLIKIWNTQYMPSLTSNSILFIDGIPEDEYEVESIISFMLHNHLFKKPKAIIFAKSLMGDQKLQQLIKERLKNNYPKNIVYGIEGMFSNNIICWELNAQTTIDFEGKIITQISR